VDFALTTEQRGLVDATRALLARKASLEKARQRIDSTEGFDADLWQLGAQLGWASLAIPEVDGGLGQQVIDLTLVAIELGRSLAATPFIPTVVVSDGVARSNLKEGPKILKSLNEGSATAAWAFAEPKQPWSARGIHARAEKRSDGYVLNGTKAHVQDAGSARWLLVDAVLDQRPARFVVATDSLGLRISAQKTLDVTRSYFDVELDSVSVPNDGLCCTGHDASEAIRRSSFIGTILVCAEIAGIGQQMLDMTVDYVTNRVQFGRPVGSFQAVKHKCADMRIWVQAITAATYYAAMAVDAATADQARAVSVAKAYASDAINRVAGEALQLHGGIGFTWEHDLHLYLRRARANSLLYGDATHHRERLFEYLEAESDSADV
jgi:alkylation response protein AidB-like acyl-CoA dehydrogenase